MNSLLLTGMLNKWIGQGLSLGQFVNPYHDFDWVRRRGLVDLMLESVGQNMHDPTLSRAWLRGNWDYQKDFKESEYYLLYKLADLGINEVDMEWLEPGQVATMTLDCENGVCETTVSNAQRFRNKGGVFLMD